MVSLGGLDNRTKPPRRQSDNVNKNVRPLICKPVLSIWPIKHIKFNGEIRITDLLWSLEDDFKW